MTVGAATFSNTADSRESPALQCSGLLDEADRALYFAKETGKNQVRHFNTLGV